MVKDHKKVWILIIGMILMAVIYNGIASVYVSRQSQIYQLVQKAKQSPPEVLAVGSSRFLAGLDPKPFNYQLMNWPIPFMDVHILNLAVKAQIETLKKSKLVILEYHHEMFVIDTLKLQPELGVSAAELEIPLSQRLGFYLKPQYWQVATIFPYLTQLRLLPKNLMAIYLARHASFTFENKGPAADLGFYARKLRGSAPQMLTLAQSTFHEYSHLYESKRVQDNLQVFSDLILYLETQNINYCWLEMPKHPWVREIEESQWTLIVKSPLQKDVERKRCVPKSVTTAFELAENFSDPNHLYFEGARRWSEELAKRLQGFY